MQKLLKYPDTIKGFNSTGLADCSKWIKRKFTAFSGQTGSNIPNAEESRTFWSGIWSVEKKHNKEAKWLSDLKEEMVKLEQIRQYLKTVGKEEQILLWRG